MMNVPSLIKLAIVFTVASPFVVRIWRNLRRPPESLSEVERRLVSLWRWQALGITAAVIAMALWLLLFKAPLAPHVPFWAVYALVAFGGSGVLITAHARELESRALLRRCATNHA